MVVTDMRQLKAMAKQGHIELHEQTGQEVEWHGQKSKAHYIKEGKPRFEYKGKKYSTGYKSGSFYPYVEPIEEEAGKFSEDKYWIHKQKAWGQLTTKSHPFDIRNNRNRKFPKLKKGYM